MLFITNYFILLFNDAFLVYSAISLASKCSTSAFRMHIRAHGTLSKVFSALHDAPDYPVSGFGEVFKLCCV